MSLLYCLMPSCVTDVLVVIVQNGDGDEVDENKEIKNDGAGDVVVGENVLLLVFKGSFSVGEPATKSASSATKVGFMIFDPAVSRYS